MTYGSDRKIRINTVYFSCNTPSPMSTRPYVRRNFDLEIIREIVKSSFSWRAVALKLELPFPSAYVYDKVRPLCNQHDIDYSHFTGQAHNRGKSFPEKRTDTQLYLHNELPISSNMLKKRLIKEGIKEHRCEVCVQTEWMGKPIPIQLHHKDGNSVNNVLDNLQIICPNCHAQTENYCGKNQARVGAYIATPDQDFLDQIPLWHNKAQVIRALGLSLAKPHYNKIGKLMAANPTVLFKPFEPIEVPDGYREISARRIEKKGDPLWRTKPKPDQRKVVRPSKEDLEKLVWEKSILQLSKEFGVTDNTVRKWCKWYEITNIPPLRYWPRRKAGWTHEEALEEIKPKQVPRRFTDAQVVEILDTFAEGKMKLTEMARRYNTHNSVLIDIREGKSYKHVPRKVVADAGASPATPE